MIAPISSMSSWVSTASAARDDDHIWACCWVVMPGKLEFNLFASPPRADAPNPEVPVERAPTVSDIACASMALASAAAGVVAVVVVRATATAERMLAKVSSSARASTPKTASRVTASQPEEEDGKGGVRMMPLAGLLAGTPKSNAPGKEASLEDGELNPPNDDGDLSKGRGDVQSARR